MLLAVPREPEVTRRLLRLEYRDNKMATPPLTNKLRNVSTRRLDRVYEFTHLDVGTAQTQQNVVNGAKQRALRLFGRYSHLCTANGPSARAMGTHGPLDPAAPEGKPAPHVMGRGKLA